MPAVLPVRLIPVLPAPALVLELGNLPLVPKDDTPLPAKLETPPLLPTEETPLTEGFLVSNRELSPPVPEREPGIPIEELPAFDLVLLLDTPKEGVGKRERVAEGLNILPLRPEVDDDPPEGIRLAEGKVLAGSRECTGVATAKFFGTVAVFGGFDTGMVEFLDVEPPLFHTLRTSDLADDKKPNLNVCPLAFSTIEKRTCIC